MPLTRAVCRPSLFRSSLQLALSSNWQRRNLSSEEDASRKVYELRTYSILPKDYGQFLTLSKEKIHLRLEVSKCIGYWCTDMGGLNEVVHIWEYEDFAHRTAVRTRLGADRTWQAEYFQRILPWLERQDNAVIYPFPWWPLKLLQRKNRGLYELVVNHLKPGSLPRFSERFRQYLSVLEPVHTPVGIWYSDVGPLDAMYTLYHYADGDNRHNVHKRLLNNQQALFLANDLMELVQFRQNKLISPAAWSPMQ